MAKNPATEYVPTYEVRDMVGRMIGHNFSMETILPFVINPNTEKPISKETFEKVFEKELKTSRAERVDACASMIFDKAMAGDLQAARTIVNLQGRGLFKKKFELNTNASIQEQINQVLEAGATGLISAEEVTHYCNAIKLKSESMLDKILELIKPLVGDQAVKDIVGGKPLC